MNKKLTEQTEMIRKMAEQPERDLQEIAKLQEKIRVMEEEISAYRMHAKTLMDCARAIGNAGLAGRLGRP